MVMEKSKFCCTFITLKYRFLATFYQNPWNVQLFCQASYFWILFTQKCLIVSYLVSFPSFLFILWYMHPNVQMHLHRLQSNGYRAFVSISCMCRLSISKLLKLRKIWNKFYMQLPKSDLASVPDFFFLVLIFLFVLMLIRLDCICFKNRSFFDFWTNIHSSQTMYCF